MFKAIAATAAALSFAGAAQAQSIILHVAGSDSATVHRQVVSAARSVCGVEFSGQPLAYYDVPSCVRDTVTATEARLHTTPVLASAADTGQDAAATVR
jgi:hypothetical protein